MTINFFRNTSPVKKVDKTITLLFSRSGTLREQTNVINPTITFQGTPASFVNTNYVEIPAFNRYYFITDIVAVNNQLCDIRLHVDVLMTYRGQFKSWSVVVARNENQYNLFLADPTIRVQENPIITRQNFPNGMTANSFILTVAGGS